MGIPDPDLDATSADPQPARWERQPTDTNKAYAGFAIYRDAGPMRSLRKAAAVLYGHDGDVSKVTSSQINQMRVWSTGNAWVARVEAWDAYLDEVSRTEQVESAKHMRRQYGEVCANLRSKLMRSAQALADSDDALTPEQVARLLPVVQQVEAWAREIPQSIAEHRHTVEEIEAAREHARERLGRLRLVSGDQ